jgi:hypothetical protein
MVLFNPPVERLQKLSALTLAQLINPLGEIADSKDGLPPCDGIGSHHRMNSLEVIADICWVTSWFFVNFPNIRFGIPSAKKPVSRESSRQALKELLIRIAITIIQLIPRRPQRITPASRELSKSQTCVIRRVLLELDITMPARSAVLSIISIFDTILKELNLRRYDADFVVAYAKLAGAVEERMDMQC